MENSNTKKKKPFVQVSAIIVLILSIRFFLNGFKYGSTLSIIIGAVLLFVSIVLFSKIPKEEPTRLNICPNGHGYSEKEHACPFCGEKEIVTTCEDIRKTNDSYSDFWYEKNGKEINYLIADVDGIIIYGDIRLRIYHTPNNIKYEYSVINENTQELTILPKSKVVLSCDDFTDTLSGLEFFAMCDKLLKTKV